MCSLLVPDVSACGTSVLWWDRRGKGLLIGMSFADGDIGYKAAAGLFQRRVLTSGTLNNAQAIRIEPALNIPMPLIDEMMNRIEDTIKELAA